jgi:hypothetical protein
MSKPAFAPLTIVRLEVENVKRLRAVNITPNGAVVILGGKNAQGKTSILDAIEMVLGGGKSLPTEPIRRGAKQASIVADLGDLVVERVITKTGTTLTVRDKDGNKLRSPQTLLDELCSRVAFDPLTFMRMDGGKQNEVLRELLGLDFTASDRRREALFAERTRVARDAKQTRARSEGIVVPPSTPAAPVLVSNLVAQLEEINRLKNLIQERQTRLDHAQEAILTAEQGVLAAQKALETARGRDMSARLAFKTIEREAMPALPARDEAVLRGEIDGAQTVNQNVQRRAERDRLEAEANAFETQAMALTGSIEELDEQKRRAIAAAPCPVPGLALGENGPTLHDIPLDQASGAQRLRVSVGIGLALNPRLKILLIRDASLLDEESLALVSDMAQNAGAQIWLERVGTADRTAVIISDGQIDDSAPANDATELGAAIGDQLLRGAQ